MKKRYCSNCRLHNVLDSTHNKSNCTYNKAQSTTPNIFLDKYLINNGKDKDISLEWNSVSFACGGWLQFYMWGVARAFQARGADNPDSITYLGCSAGAMTATGLTLDCDFDAALKYCKENCSIDVYKGINGLFKLKEYMSKCTEEFIIPRFKNVKEGLLQITTTKLSTFEAKRIIKFNNSNELKEALYASSAAFPMAPLFSHSTLGYLSFNYVFNNISI